MAAYQDLYLDKGIDFTEVITLSDDYGDNLKVERTLKPCGN